MTKLNNPASIPQVSSDFIIGLICGIGSFLWVIQLSGQRKQRQKIAVFQVKVNSDNQEVLWIIKQHLGLTETIHQYQSGKQSFSLLIVRKRRTIEQIIIPFFDNRLFGSKKKQFEQWKQKFLQEKENWQYHYISYLN